MIFFWELRSRALVDFEGLPPDRQQQIFLCPDFSISGKRTPIANVGGNWKGIWNFTKKSGKDSGRELRALCKMNVDFLKPRP